jgi:hypothetical protein
MKTLKSYLPYIFAGVLFFAGRWTKTSDTSELERKLALQNKYHELVIDSLKGDLIDKDKAIATIREQRYKDSLETSNELRARDRAILKQQKENEKINLSRATSAELDSVRAIILRSVN